MRYLPSSTSKGTDDLISSLEEAKATGRKVLSDLHSHVQELSGVLEDSPEKTVVHYHRRSTDGTGRE